MPDLIETETQRLVLRQWTPEDRAPFAALNGDPVAMEYFPATLDRAQSDALADRIEGLIAEKGWGFWAVERKDTGAFIGFTGLHEPKPHLPMAPCVEVGWRLLPDHWRQGFATEAAREALRVGFERLDLAEIVSFTALANVRSQKVMERLGMARDADFAHPDVAEGHPLRVHCLYRLPRTRWASS